MSILTHSKWYFGFDVDATNSSIDFSEGGPELQGIVRVGSYTASELADEIARALNDFGLSLTYSCTFDRITRTFTISADGNFELLVATGSRLGTSVYSTIGFTTSDRTGDDEYEGDLPAGSEYVTQFILQDYIPVEHSKGANEGTVNISASGEVEVFKFGTKQFMTCSLKYVSNYITGSHVIRDDASGVAKLLEFLDFAITKAPLEFMPDDSDPNTFQKMLLESTEKDKNGIQYELKEMLGQKLPGFYETGKLIFRLIE